MVSYYTYWLVYQLLGLWSRNRILQSTRDPKNTQLQILKRILKSAQSSTNLNLSGLNSSEIVEVYQTQVGLSQSDQLATKLGGDDFVGQSNLTSRLLRPLELEELVDRSSSVGLSIRSARQAKSDVRMMTNSWMRRGSLFRGKVFSVLEEQEESEEGFGDTGQNGVAVVQQHLPSFIRKQCFIPKEIPAIRESEERHFALATLALSEHRVTGVLTYQPSLLLDIAAIANKRLEEICQSIATGRFPNEIRRGSRSEMQLTANPIRAKSLLRLRSKRSELTFGDWWPRLRGVVCSTSVSDGRAIQNLREQLPSHAKIIDFGHLSIAGITAINLDIKTDAAIPTLHRNYFEFVERSSWDAGFAEVQRLDELEVGEEYYVILTNQTGSLRLEINEIVKVVGKYYKTPMLELKAKPGSLSGNDFVQT